MKKTAWEQFKELVNSKKIGEIITRREILDSCNCSSNNCDYMRNICEKSKFLEKYSKASRIVPGIFIVRRPIPPHTSISEVRGMYERFNYEDEIEILNTKIKDAIGRGVTEIIIPFELIYPNNVLCELIKKDNGVININYFKQQWTIQW